VEARVLERESCSRTGSLDELGLVEQRRIVDERGERLALVVELRDGAAGDISGQLHGRPGRVDELPPFRQPERNFEPRVAERAGKRVA
jgi:hypothetical protein